MTPPASHFIPTGNDKLSLHFLQQRNRPLHLAARRGHVDVVKILISEFGAEVDPVNEVRISDISFVKTMKHCAKNGVKTNDDHSERGNTLASRCRTRTATCGQELSWGTWG